MTATPETQADKFKDGTRAAKCDPDENHWEERLKKLAQQKSEKPE